MSLEKITQQEIYDASMERLANYPTAASRYGIGGLNDRQLKARYDKLAKLAIAKLNVLIDSINSPAESADALLKLLITPIPGETEDVYLTLCDVLEDVISGDLATYLALEGLAKGNLQAELEELERLISDKVSKIAGKGLSTNDFSNAEKAALAANTEARHSHLNKSVLDSTTAPYTTEEKDKLKAIEKGAQVNPEIIDNLTSVSADNPLSANQGRLLNEKVDGKQPAGNYATLVDGKIPSSQLPSYVDDVIEKPTRSEFPVPGESGKIYVAQDTNITYRWSGTGYVEISQSLALGETAQTAFRGDHGKSAYEHSQSSGNPHGTTAEDIGIFIKQGTGDSETAVMSQKATTAEINALKDDLTDLDEILNVKHLRITNVTTKGSYVRAIAFSGLSLIGGHSYTFTVKPVSVTTNEYYLYFVDASGAETVINDRTDRITYNFTPTENMNNVSIKVSSSASSEQTFECSWIENVGDNEIVTVNKKIDDLFDGTDLVELSILNGHFVTGASGHEGTIGGDNYSCVTSLIPVRPNDKLRIDNVYLDSNRSICAYDEEGNFVEVIAKDKTDKVTSYTFTVPENCYYIRATGKINIYPTVTFLSIPNNLDSLRVENPIATITNGYYITRYSGLEGAVDNSSDSAITDYIPVKPNSVINIDGIYNEGNRCTCCYDKNKKFVSVISSSLTRTNFSKNIKIPSNARYIRITSRKDVVPTIKYVNTIIDGTNVSNPYVNGKELFDSSALKPVLTFIDDDTWGIQYVTRQKELCDRLGIKCSFACLTEQVEKNEGLLELLLSYELEGFPIIFHANQQIIEYESSSLDVVAEERDFVTGLQKMHKFGFSDYKIWCTPFGGAREDQKKLAYKWGFDGLVTSGYVNAFNNPYEYSSRFAIKRCSLGSNTDKTASDIVDDVANLKLAIDNASECNGWVCISTHSAYNLYLNGEADDAMEEIVNYAISKGFEIRTVNEELRRRMPIYRYYEQF